MNAPADLTLLRSFVAVAEELHFGRAAQRLHMAQPPLSMRIRRLEDDLGVRLLERSRRHVALTEAGAYLLARARDLLAEAEQARLETQRVARGEGGVLSIGYTPTATFDVLPRVLAAFRSRRPDVRLELREMASPQQPEAIRRGRIEIGFACGPVEADGVLEAPLLREALILALPAGHALGRRPSVPVQRLAGLPLVLVRPDVEPAWAQASLAALRKARVPLQVVQETDTKIAQLGLVAAGVGGALVSESVERLGRHGVVFRRLAGLDLRLPLVLLTAAAPTPRARDCADLARGAVRA